MTESSTQEKEPYQRSLQNTEIFRPEWVDSTEITRWLDREMFIGETLNFPCGKSILGDVRVDIDPSVNPDVLADLDHIPFKNNQFDTVYCDPPYSYHAYDKNRFALELWDVAAKRLILQTKNQKYRFEGADRTVYLAESHTGMAYQIFQVFDTQNQSLADFSER